MQLQGRDLSNNLQGDDVRFLHLSLRQLGYEVAEYELREGLFGTTTRQVVILFQQTHGMEETGIVDHVTAQAITTELNGQQVIIQGPRFTIDGQRGGDSTFIVKGHIHYPDGSPASQKLVRVFHIQLRRRQALGEGSTNTKGDYEISYQAAPFKQEQVQPNLLIQVLNNQREIEGTSPVHYKAEPIETIDAEIAPPGYILPSHYDQLLAQSTSQLHGMRPEDLTAHDITFLAGATGNQTQQIQFLAEAHRAAKETGISPEVLFGLFQQQQTGNVQMVLAQWPEMQRTALTLAIAAGTVSSRWSDQLESVVNQLQQAYVQQVLKTATSASGGTLRDLLRTAGLSSPQAQEKIATLYAQQEKAGEDFWQKLGQEPEFSDAHLPETLRATLTLDELVQNHLPLVEAVQSLQRAGRISDPSDLVRLTERDWLDMISGSANGRGAGFPPGTPGQNDQEKAHTYARAIMARVEAAYPTAAVVYHLSQSDHPGNPDLAHFLAHNQGFDLGSTHIDRYLKLQGEQALTGIRDPQQLVANLKGVQRIFKLTPRYSQIQPLLEAGLTSSQHIASLSKETFLAQYANKLGGESEAEAIFHRADYIASHALALHAQYSVDYNAVSTNVLLSLPSQVDAIPNWSTLFGPSDFCDCKECRSVLSPAAYFVDILQFLKHNAKEVGGSRTGKDVLFDHRPDLGILELSCENTNTPLPYIDLVNEVLENRVSPSATGTPALQTHHSAAELLTHPEYVNDAAYAQLARQVYPWSFPFNLGTLQARVYLKQAGLSRYELLETFYPLSETVETTSLAVLQDTRVAAEYLGLTPGEWDLLTGMAPQSAAECWGFGATPPAGWVSQLSSVQALLDRSGLHYEDLLRLLDTAYINPLERGIAIPSPATEYPHLHLVAGSSQCNLTEMTVQNLNEAVLRRIQRFVRLWRRLGWDLFDLDKVITVLRLSDTAAPFSFTSDFLVQVAHLQRLHMDLRLPVLTVLSWWANIDTAKHQGESLVPSLYDQVYQNTITLSDPADRAIFKLDAAGLALATPDQQLQNHLVPLCAVLGLGVKDLQFLLTTFNESKMTLETLSQLYRSVTLARALKLSIKEFISCKKLTQIDPFAASPPNQPFDAHFTAQSLWFIQKVKTIQSSAFRVTDLDALLLNATDQVFTPATATTATAARLLTDLRSALTKVADTSVTASQQKDDPATLAVLDAADASQPGTLGKLSYQQLLDVLSKRQAQIGTQTQQLLPLIWNTDIVLQAISIMNGTAPWSFPLASLPSSVTLPANINIAYDSSTRQLQFTGNMTWDEEMRLCALSSDDAYLTALKNLFRQPRQFIETNMGSFLDLTAAEAQLFSTNGAVCALLDALPPTITFPVGMKISYDAVNKLLWFVGIMTESEKAQLLGLSTDTSYQDAVIALYSQLTLAKAVRYGYIYKLLDAYLNASCQILIQKLGEPLKITGENTTVLLKQLKLVPLDPSEPPLLATFLEPDFLASVGALQPASWPGQFQAVALLQSCAQIITKFTITTSEVNWLLRYGPVLGWLDLNSLPPVGPNITSSLFAGWERLVGVFSLRNTYPALRDTMPDSNTALFDLFARLLTATISETDLLQELNQRLGWSTEDVKALVDPACLNCSFPAAWQDERVLLRLKGCFAILKRMQISAARAWSWTTTTQQWNWAAPNAIPELQVGEDVEKALKATYADDQWLDIAGPLRDQLREPQRDALVAYLLVHPELLFTPAQKPDDLFAQLYLDVEMNACQLTSRTKQAISSAQLFVQRCLMGLEQHVTISQEGANEWNQWMKRDVIWRANREVFVKAANWIVPELRDDKSPFFLGLENDLLQNEITSDAAENAFLNYLEKLDEVAHLEVCGMYHQVEWSGCPLDLPFAIPDAIAQRGAIDVDILHVFARTPDTTPHVYYYRRRINGRTWTPWEKVDLDIEGNHLIPVIYERRLHLFWPTFTKKQPDPNSAIPDNSTDKPQVPPPTVEMHIAWSEYRNGKWSAKRVSNEVMEMEGPRAADIDKTELIFRAMVLDDLPILFCYYDPYNVLSQTWQAIRTQAMRLGPFVGYFAFTGCHGQILTGNFVDITSGVSNPAWINPLVTLAPTIWQNIGQYAWKLFGPIELSAVATGIYFILRMLSPLALPRTSIENMTFKERDTDSSTGDYLFPSLRKTPGIYRVLYPEQSNLWVLGLELLLLLLYSGTTGNSYTWNDLPSFVQLQELLEMFFFRDGLHTYFVTFQFEPSRELATRNARLRHLDRNSLYRLAANQPARSLITSSPLPVEAAPVAEIPTASLIGDVLNTTDARTAAMQAVAERVTGIVPRYRFETFYHPYLCELIKVLNRYGIDGLLNPDPASPLRRQLERQDYFKEYYDPDALVDTHDTHYPVDDYDFSPGGAYSLYNWELFFHAPLLIACRLMQNQKFAEAQRWFHYIFDPTVGHEPLTPPPKFASQRYWKIRPFYQNNDVQTQIDALLARLDDPAADPQKKQDLEDQIEDWRQNPFQPHRIARARIRPYQETVVMKYLDNLIAWGDQLFSMNTIEAINEATQLYILAAEILGPRPVDVPPQQRVGNKTYNDLESRLDEFSNAQIEAEEFIELPYQGSVPSPFPMQTIQMVAPKIFYFCIPRNDKLLGYWDTVADRLFKIRNCMNIEGVVRQLPLFEPPIDPALLVQAAAAGIDLGSMLNSLNVTLSPYRFPVLIQKALELCNEVKSLGAALLSALEKRDAERLALLRSSLELQLLDSVQKVKEAQVNEAQYALQGLQKNQETVRARQQYYASRPYTNAHEKLHAQKLDSSMTWQKYGQISEVAAAAVHIIPILDIGASGWAASPVAKALFGGANMGNALQATAKAMGLLAQLDTHAATMAQIEGSNRRRQDDWAFQADQASKELDQLDKQITAATIRVTIAEQELQNHLQQRANEQTIDDYMHTKYTNQDLYDWMVSQISAIYFQCYRMAHEVAKKAERSFQHELGAYSASFIQPTYWNSLKKGLLVGDQLYQDLKHLEMAYYEQNRREFEITRHLSLNMLDPMALARLKETGNCHFTLPEVLFDLDYPGHYMRRIKSVSLTIPCVIGPYTSVNCTLTLTKNTVRIKSDPAGAEGTYTHDVNGDDSRFLDNVGAIQSIVTSSGQNDSGLFEVNLRDERYNPFEGAGLIESQWRLQLPLEDNRFDFATIPDVILHIRYTARDGGETLRTAAREARDALLQIAQTQQQVLVRAFSARHDFSSDWYRFLQPVESQQDQFLSLTLNKDHFSTWPGNTLQITRIVLLCKLNLTGMTDTNIQQLTLSLTTPDGSETENVLLKKIDVGDVLVGAQDYTNPIALDEHCWQVTLSQSQIAGLPPGLHHTVTVNDKSHESLNPEAIEDLGIICVYTLVQE